MINEKPFRVDTLIIGLALAIAGGKYTHALQNSLDVTLFDETGYLCRGVRLFRAGFPKPVWGPLYSAWYFLLSLFQPDPASLYYTNYKIQILAVPILLYVVLRRYAVAVRVALPTAFLFLISTGNLTAWPRVSHFVIIFILGILIVASFLTSDANRCALNCVGALLASYVRPEFLVAFALSALLYIWVVVARRQYDRPTALVCLGLATCSAVLLGALGAPIEGQRSLIAFGQHFALNWLGWTDRHDLSPWTDWRGIFVMNFGQVHSVTGAVFANPRMFMRHVATNLLDLPVHYMEVGIYHSPVFLPSAFIRLEALALLGLLAVIGFRSRRGFYWSVRSGVRSSLIMLLLLCCYAVTSFLVVVVVYPMDHYVIILGTLTILGIAIAGAPREGEKNPRAERLVALGLLMIALTPAPSFPQGPPAVRPIVETLDQIRSLNITGKVRLLELDGGYDCFLPDNFTSVMAYVKHAGFTRFQAATGTNMIVVSEALMDDSRFRDDPEWLAFLQNYSRAGYSAIPVPRTGRRLLVATSLLSGAVPHYKSRVQ